MTIKIESETASPDQGSGAGEWSQSYDWLPKIPIERKSVVLGYYMDALRQGYSDAQAKAVAIEAEEIAHEKSQPLPATNMTHETNQDNLHNPDDYREPHEETSAPARHGSLALFALIVGAVAVLSAVAYFIPSTSELDKAISAREKAARAYHAAQGEAMKTQMVLDKLKAYSDAEKARYEASYKREACIVSGACK